MSGASPSTAATTFDQSGYWYESDSQERGAAVLNALRRYRQAEKDMRARTRLSMKMGETDLTAIRFLLREQRADRTVNASQLAEHLGITTASTAVLINRLEKSGHIERRANPADKRGVLLTATGDSDEEVRATMAGMHAQMIIAAEKLRPDVAQGVLEFLQEMTDALDSSVATDLT
ncbi:MarR family winged helix-turn-helix transcriptional regulator [Frondihabitans australicus]|uniref:DNA-binding MarR family transcriptional regulator n=1 Tax=Frondihabitans australicus TaxID=386892 RepID=A0A495IHM6_9MICO|nr:MarR family transcriptional regulator [Frondihabitans australicus]RKR74811.1 DNA-binding MarR family transcriptional regulator [Frondihabitans australicus]